MKDDPVYNIHFIRLIQRYPQLYNKSLAAYVNKREINRVWREIAGILNETVTNCITKWTTLRNTYNRMIQNNYSDANAFRKSKFYYLANNMQFLLPFMTPNPADYIPTEKKPSVPSNLGTETTPAEIVDAPKRVPTVVKFALDDCECKKCTGDPVKATPKRQFRRKSIKRPTFLVRAQQVPRVMITKVPMNKGSKERKKDEALTEQKHEVDGIKENKETEEAKETEETKGTKPKNDTNGTKSYLVRANPIVMHKKKRKPLNEVNVKESCAKIEKPQTRRLSDSDIAFFRSILPLVEKLSDRQKIRFRICAMQLLELFTKRQATDNVPNIKLFSPSSCSNIHIQQNLQ